jgi:2-oxoglutarate dehydrogenase E2 component (dihydrolipoamide succinyltransferase)
MKIDVAIPQVGESITEVTIGQWVKKDGELVEMDEVLCEIESEKATLELRSESNGKLKILAKELETPAVGTKIAEIDTDVKVPAKEKQEEEKSAEQPEEKAELVRERTEVKTEVKPEEKEEEKATKISPVAAKLLKEAGISSSQVAGSGQQGRITKADAEKVIDQASEKAEGPAPVPEQKPEPAPQKIPEPKAPVVFKKPVPGTRTENREKMSTLRKTIARRLVEAKNETAMLTTFNEIDMSAIVEVRNRYQEEFQNKYGIKLGFMSFFIKASCIALQEFPPVNALLENDEIVYHDYCDISIAVSTPRGLVVPVIFNAETMTIPQLEAEVNRLATKGRDNKLTLDEMTGGTFSITNGGVFGSLLSTPIINAPQTAILGLHKIEERPVALNGELVIRPMMYVAVSYDHRVIDGKESVNFLLRIKELMEDPTRILLDI